MERSKSHKVIKNIYLYINPFSVPISESPMGREALRFWNAFQFWFSEVFRDNGCCLGRLINALINLIWQFLEAIDLDVSGVFTLQEKILFSPRRNLRRVPIFVGSLIDSADNRASFIKTNICRLSHPLFWLFAKSETRLTIFSKSFAV